MFINGNTISLGYSKLENLDDLEVLVISPQTAETTFFIINEKDHFIIGPDKLATFNTKSDGQVVIHENSLSIDVKQDFLYLNNQSINGHQFIEKVKTGFQILSPDYLLEKEIGNGKSPFSLIK